MGLDHRSARWLFVLVTAALTPMVLPGTAMGQESSLTKEVAGTTGAPSPFAVGGSARKPLPPLDCLQCPGPCPHPPCGPHHQTFLYYGTYPGNHVNTSGCGDGVDSSCGQLAAKLSRFWIHLHRNRERTSPGCQGTDCDGPKGDGNDRKR